MIRPGGSACTSVRWDGATLDAHCRGVAGLVAGEIGLILDEVLIDADYRDKLFAALVGKDVLTVGVHCDIAELERRENARGDRLIGQARGQFDTVHAGQSYDIEVDTTATVTAIVIDKIIAALMSGDLNASAGM